MPPKRSKRISKPRNMSPPPSATPSKRAKRVSATPSTTSQTATSLTNLNLESIIDKIVDNVVAKITHSPAIPVAEPRVIVSSPPSNPVVVPQTSAAVPLARQVNSECFPFGAMVESLSSPDSLTPQNAVMNTLLSASISHSTTKLYTRVWKHFNEFFNTHFTGPLTMPISLEVLAHYITNLYINNFSAATIATYISAISFVHKSHNVTDPADTFLIRKLLKGVNNSKGSSDSRLPITLHILHKLVSAVDKVLSQHFKVTLCRAMFLLAFHAFLRVGEMTTTQNKSSTQIIQVSDVSFSYTQGHVDSMTIIITHFKHNDLHPFTLYIPIQGEPEFCPVRAIQKYIRLNRHTVGPLFQFSDGTPVSRGYFATTLRNTLAFLRLDTDRYKGHSFRIGAATSAAAKGMSEVLIQKLGRWKSGAVNRYVRLPSFA